MNETSPPTETTSSDWVRSTLTLSAPTTESEDSLSGVGDLDLAPFQSRAARRGLEIARRYGGVLLADSVGLGKTRVALAVANTLQRDARLARATDEPVWLCVPAKLRDQWRRALEQAEIAPYRIVSHTEMSRGAVEQARADPAVIVADEAHRFRNPDANRREALAALCGRAPIVMATATPVCNSIDDLYHLFELFLAESDLRPVLGRDLSEAFELGREGEFDLTELVRRVTIRRTDAPSSDAFGRLPDVNLALLTYRADEDERWIWANLEATLREIDFSACADQWPPHLIVEYALRRWESGPDALWQTLRSLVDFHERWLRARSRGRSLSHSEYRELFDAETGANQEVFPFLYPQGDNSAAAPGCDEVRDDLRLLGELEERARSIAAEGGGRLSAIAECAAERVRKMLAFTKYRRAAAALYELLCERLGPRGRVGLITGERATATGLGRCEPHDLLRRFAPRAQSGDPLPAHQQIRVLVSTDCLSEGINLQDCGTVVLADLPYSPLSVEQRIGRLVRPGGPHDDIEVLLPRPEDWNDTLGMRRRLRTKLGDARRSGLAPTAASALESEQPDRATRRSGAPERSGDTDGSASSAAGATPPDRNSVPPEETPSADRRPSSETLMTRGAVGDVRPAPLAALTKLDALRRRVESNSRAPDQLRSHRAEAAIDGPCLWLYVRAASANHPDPRWWLIRPNGAVERRLGVLLPGLVALYDAELALEPTPPEGELWERAERAVDEREQFLEGSRLAPEPLDFESVQSRLWRHVRRLGDDDSSPVGGDDLEALRRRLLRPFPRGTVRRLERLADAERPAGLTYRRARDIVDRAARTDEPVELRIAGGLELRPSHE